MSQRALKTISYFRLNRELVSNLSVMNHFLFSALIKKCSSVHLRAPLRISWHFDGLRATDDSRFLVLW
jgi:hypothetical protein